MRGRFSAGIVAGSIIGATAGMYALHRTNPRQRRRLMRRGGRAIRNASKAMDVVSSINMFK